MATQSATERSTASGRAHTQKGSTMALILIFMILLFFTMIAWSWSPAFVLVTLGVLVALGFAFRYWASKLPPYTGVRANVLVFWCKECNVQGPYDRKKDNYWDRPTC